MALRQFKLVTVSLDQRPLTLGLLNEMSRTCRHIPESVQPKRARVTDVVRVRRRSCRMLSQRP